MSFLGMTVFVSVGMDMPIEAKEIKDRFDVPDDTKEVFARKAKEWAANYRRRGCI